MKYFLKLHLVFRKTTSTLKVLVSVFLLLLLLLDQLTGEFRNTFLFNFTTGLLFVGRAGQTQTKAFWVSTEIIAGTVRVAGPAVPEAASQGDFLITWDVKRGSPTTSQKK